MTDTTSQGPADFDPQALESYLKTRFPGISGPLAIERIAGGQSNPTYFVDFGDRRLVLRKKPAGVVLPTAHAVDREYRIMSALAGTDVPVPEMLAYEEDEAILGTPFYLMERLEGRVMHDSALPGLTRDERREAFRSLAQTLAKLHAVDWKALGLEDYGRHSGYFDRQIARWTKQWRLSKTRDLPDIERLIEWLPAHAPQDDLTTVVHGDYRFGNVMLHATEPRVIGILDWELSTLGHPLADLAHLCTAWHATRDEYLGVAGCDLDALGIPDRESFAEDYYRHCGHDRRLTPFHMAFALFRFAVIFEGIAARAQSGTAAAQNAEKVGRLSAAFARHGVDVIDSQSF